MLVLSRLRPGLGFVLATLIFAAALVAAPAHAQAIVKVNDNINFKLGILLQPQFDSVQVADATNTSIVGFQSNFLIRRLRLLVGGQLAKNVFFFAETENLNLGKSTQPITGGAGGKSLTTGFTLLDAVVEWRIAKEFNLMAGEIRVPVSREALKASGSSFEMDFSAYTFQVSTALQNQSLRDTGFQSRGYFLDDHLEIRAGMYQGAREVASKNSFRFAGRAQYNFLDTEVYNMPSYAGNNFGTKKIVALGGAFDRQRDYKLVSGDLFVDVPIPMGSFISTIEIQHIDGGTIFTTLPQQNTVQVEGGVYSKALKVGGYVRYEQLNFTASDAKNEQRGAVGLNYYPYGNTFNIKAWYQKVTPRVGPAKNQFTLQFQVYYF